MVQGTAREVIDSQSLYTWSVSGDALPELATRLRQLQSVEQVAAFGNTLHVTGTDKERMGRELQPLMAESGREWKEVSPGLEDVFIHLMGASSEPVTEIH
jgi:ABC-2 type transport system ATP-binding protein